MTNCCLFHNSTAYAQLLGEMTLLQLKNAACDLLLPRDAPPSPITINGNWTSGNYSGQRAEQWQVHLQLTFSLLGMNFMNYSLELFSARSAALWKCGLGSVRMGQCTESGGSLICPSHFFQRTVGGAGTGAEQMLSLGKLVGKFATKSCFIKQLWSWPLRSNFMYLQPY